MSVLPHFLALHLERLDLMLKLKLEWKIINRDQVSLIFDTSTWLLLQDKANARGMETTTMVAEAIANLLGPVVATKQ